MSEKEEVLLLTESGVWMSLLKADTPPARAFRGLVARAILPTLRQSGLLAELVRKHGAEYPEARDLLEKLRLTAVDRPVDLSGLPEA